MPAATTKEEFYEIIRRITPEEFWASLSDSRGGGELFKAWAAIYERVSQARARQEAALLISTCSAPGKAQFTARFSRTNTVGAVTVLSGSEITSEFGRRYRTLSDAVFADTDDGPVDVVVEADQPGAEWNFEAGFAAANGDTIPALAFTVSLPRLLPSFGNTTIVVAAVSAATGGTFGALALHAEERGLSQLPGESHDAFLLRVDQTRLHVTPDQITEFIHVVLDQYLIPSGLTFTVVETWEQGFVGVWDPPDQKVGDFDPAIWVYDDFRVADGTPSPPGNGLFWGRWLDSSDLGNGFVVVVPLLPVIAAHGFVIGDPATAMSDLASTIGKRAPGCVGFPTALVAQDVLPPAIGGRDFARDAAYLGLRIGLEQIKPAGTTVSLELARG